MEERSHTIRSIDFQDYCDALNPELGEEICIFSKEFGKTDMINVRFRVKSVKDYLKRVAFNLKETRARMELQFGYKDW